MNENDYIKLMRLTEPDIALRYQTVLQDYDIDAIICPAKVAGQLLLKVPEEQLEEARDIIDRVNHIDEELEHEYFEANEYDDSDDDKIQIEKSFITFDPDESFTELGRELSENFDFDAYQEE